MLLPKGSTAAHRCRAALATLPLPRSHAAADAMPPPRTPPELPTPLRGPAKSRPASCSPSSPSPPSPLPASSGAASAWLLPACVAPPGGIDTGGDEPEGDNALPALGGGASGGVAASTGLVGSSPSRESIGGITAFGVQEQTSRRVHIGLM